MEKVGHDLLKARRIIKIGWCDSAQVQASRTTLGVWRLGQLIDELTSGRRLERLKRSEVILEFLLQQPRMNQPIHRKLVRKQVNGILAAQRLLMTSPR